MKDPIDFYRGTHRAYWDADYDIRIKRRYQFGIVRDALVGLIVIFAVVVLASVQ